MERVGGVKARGWTCPRVAGGVVCRHRNPPRTRKCGLCGKPRPAKRLATHLKALEDLDYEGFIRLNGGEHCAICGRLPSQRRRLDRDHCHLSGKPRGLLCARCNRALPSWVTLPWLVRAARYIEERGA